MKKNLLITLFLLLGAARAALGYEIAVVKGNHNLPADLAGQAFIRELEKTLPSPGLKAIVPHSFHEILIEKNESESSTRTRISAVRPDLILALGPKALTAARGIATVPVISLLVFSPEKIIAGQANITGITLNIPAKIQLDEMSRLLPGVKRVGVIYDPVRSNDLLGHARTSRPDLEFVAIPATNEKEVAGLLHKLEGRIDLVWLLPDLTVFTPHTFPLFLRFSFENRIPLLSFAEQHLKSGAALVVTFDVEAMGQEAAEIATRLFHGEPAAKIGMKNATRVKTLVNDIILQKMNISVQGNTP